MTRPINCDHCQDQGIVELAGADRDGYSRGSAPCRWCDAGQKLQKKLAADKHHPLTDYSVHSLAATPQPGYHAVTKTEALAEWETCDHVLEPQGPPQARPWKGDSVQWTRCQRCGKEEAHTIPHEPHHHRSRPSY